MDWTAIPKRTFLDTSVVNFMLDYGAEIYDNAPVPAWASDRVSQDIESLRGIVTTGYRASWQFAISPSTYEEVSNTTDPSRRRHLNGWFAELWQYWSDIARQDNNPRRPNGINPKLIELLDILPDVRDRELICDAITNRCDSFCTRDWKTILKYRPQLQILPIEIRTPTEWWKLIGPYAALWK